MTMKSVLVGATAIAIALTSFDLRPAAAAPLGGAATAQSRSDATDISAQRKRKRGYRGNPAVPLAAFGAIIGTIGAVAAANSRRDYYDRQYYGGPTYYGGPAYGAYDGPPAHYYRAPRGNPYGVGRGNYVNVPGTANYGGGPAYRVPGPPQGRGDGAPVPGATAPVSAGGGHL